MRLINVSCCDLRLLYATAIIVAIGTLYRPADCARILAIETVPGKSHWNFVSSVLRALTDAGHTVTVFTPFPEGDRENYTEVDTSSDRVPRIVGADFTELQTKLNTLPAMIRFLVILTRSNCDVFHDNRRLDDLLAEGLRSNFDAIVVEPVFPDCLTYLAVDSGLPLIFTVTTAMNLIANVDHTSNPATVSTILSDHAVLRTFDRRLSNVATLINVNVMLFVWGFLAKLFDPKPYDSYTTAPSAVMFLNGHFTTDAPSPIPPITVNVGGIHLRPVKMIPKDILDFIDDSPQGVILLTFGSTVSVSTIPTKILKDIIDVLTELPQRVLLKYESEMEDKPKNVMIRKWLPQRDILMHPNVKLFISHGGLSGVYEAVDAGIPVLGFPLFADQSRNIDNLVEAGMAISMEILSVTKDTFLKNILELVNNETYTKNAKIASNIFKDRPMTPQQSVVYWTEYVIRHKGAPHLKSQAYNLTWYQYLLLDVIGMLLILFCIISFMIYILSKIVYKYTMKYYVHIKSEKSE